MTAISVSRFVKAAAVVLAMATLASGCAANRTLGAGVDDAAADVQLKTKLLTDNKYDYTDVDITTFEARLMLTGTMRSEEGKAHAEALASEAANVHEVINEIVVGPRTGFRQGTRDAVIDRQLAAALRGDTGIIRGNYQFAVSDGIIYMMGVAQGPQELTRATEQARRIGGVKKVVSHVMYVGDPARVTR